MAAGPVDVAAAVRRESGILADDAAFARIERDVIAELVGAGPLEPLLALAGVTDVLVNSAREVWIDRGAGLERAASTFDDDAAVRRLAQRLAAACGRRLDDSQPFVDAVLPDGTRLHAVVPPITAHPTLSLRVLARRRFRLDDLVGAGLMSTSAAALLRAIVDAGLAFLVSGGTGTGKTTLLGALLSSLDPRERVVLIEDVPELVTDHGHLVSLTARMPNIEGAGEVTMRDLVRHALRMRPDRLIVGEFRGAEFGDLLAALNTGHEGAAATLHANSLRDVPARVAALGALSGLDLRAAAAQAISAFDVVIQLGRARGRAGPRVLEAIGVVAEHRSEFTIEPVWTRHDPTPVAADRLRRLLADRGISDAGRPGP